MTGNSMKHVSPMTPKAGVLSDADLDQVHGGLVGDDVGVLRTGKVVGGQEGEPLTDAGKTGSVMADDVVINWKSR